MAAALEEEREAAAAAVVGRNVERRKWKAEQKDLLDEMLPKAEPGRWDTFWPGWSLEQPWTVLMEEPMVVLSI